MAYPRSAAVNRILSRARTRGNAIGAAGGLYGGLELPGHRDWQAASTSALPNQPTNQPLAHAMRRLQIKKLWHKVMAPGRCLGDLQAHRTRQIPQGLQAQAKWHRRSRRTLLLKTTAPAARPIDQ
jgi:hypothetical protein